MTSDVPAPPLVVELKKVGGRGVPLFFGIEVDFCPVIFAQNATSCGSQCTEAVVFKNPITPPPCPCRISLTDAEPGEEVLLVNFEYQPAHSPYRAAGPIFVRRDAEVFDSTDVPPALRPRLLSLRAYDDAGMMVEADFVEGTEVETLLTRLFGRDDISYIHVHYAKRGCFAARVDRAQMKAVMQRYRATDSVSSVLGIIYPRQAN